MKNDKNSFSDFKVGDYVTFEREYTHDEFLAFSEISGDQNPLHSNVNYAKSTEYEECIVPLHLSTMPLSMVAGMIFPGDPSLYLGHEIRSINYIPFDCKITYSIKISSINTVYRILELDFVAFRTKELIPVLEGKLKIQSRKQEWRPLHRNSKIVIRGSEKWVLITGATGEIGAAIAESMARMGYHLLLQARNNNKNTSAIATRLSEQYGIKVEFVFGDLSNSEELFEIEQVVKLKDELYTIVHVACPPVMNPLAEHVAVSYSALKILVDAVMPAFLSQQKGKIVLIGTSAMENPVIGWESYVAGKSMAVNFVNTINNRYIHYGISGLTIAPGLVRTRYSSEFRNESDSALLPEEFAEYVVDVLGNEIKSNYLLVNVDEKKQGDFGFRNESNFIKKEQVDINDKSEVILKADKITNNISDQYEVELEILIRDFFRLPESYDVSNAALGVTPGWDSLRSIELLLVIENKFKISFSADEIEKTHNYSDLFELLQIKHSE